MSFGYFFSFLFQYDTPKIVTIRSKKIGLLSRFIQICILGYIIGYVMLYKKGYQEAGYVESAVTTKVKGITVTNLSSEDFADDVPESYRSLYNRVWDVTEYVVPSSENEAFFVTTNVIITPNQTLGVCDEDPDTDGAICTGACDAGQLLPLGNGMTTGRCIPSTQKPGMNVCEIQAWCPVEVDKSPLKQPVALMQGAENYTVLLKNSISFPIFGDSYKRNNILRSSNATYLQSCIYNNVTDSFCPVFRLGDMVQQAGYNFSEMSFQGGVISIVIQWYCDLDWDFFEYCRPKYFFQRLDDPNSKISPGWNFRHSYHHEYNRRTLFKAFGIRFVIDVQGQARKFNLIPTMLNIGAGLALMGVTTICCDLVVLYITKNRHYYKENKYQKVDGDDVFLFRSSLGGYEELSES